MEPSTENPKTTSHDQSDNIANSISKGYYVFH